MLYVIIKLLCLPLPTPFGGWAWRFVVLDLMWFLCFFFRMDRLEGTEVEEEMGEFIIILLLFNFVIVLNAFSLTFRNYFD